MHVHVNMCMELCSSVLANGHLCLKAMCMSEWWPRAELTASQGCSSPAPEMFLLCAVMGFTVGVEVGADDGLIGFFLCYVISRYPLKISGTFPLLLILTLRQIFQNSWFLQISVSLIAVGVIAKFSLITPLQTL